jgi:glutamine cyclotransferase
MASVKKSNRKFFRIIFIILFAIILALLALIIFTNTSNPQRSISSIPEELAPQMTFEVINEYPHDPDAFTQGLIYLDGYFYESTGLYGRSSLRKVDIISGEVLQIFDLPSQYFAEGLAHWDGQLIQLTWQENTGFIYDLQGFSLLEQFSYPTEGWGLTQDGEHLIMSDGSSTLFFLDPASLQVVYQKSVTQKGEEVVRLNELEYVLGEVFANIWQTDTIVRIDPESGQVLGEIDLSGILPDSERTPQTDVLNGIAYDPESDRLFITGKLWTKVFEIRLVPVESEN